VICSIVSCIQARANSEFENGIDILTGKLDGKPMIDFGSLDSTEAQLPIPLPEIHKSLSPFFRKKDVCCVDGVRNFYFSRYFRPSQVIMSPNATFRPVSYYTTVLNITADLEFLTLSLHIPNARNSQQASNRLVLAFSGYEIVQSMFTTVGQESQDIQMVGSIFNVTAGIRTVRLWARTTDGQLRIPQFTSTGSRARACPCGHC